MWWTYLSTTVLARIHSQSAEAYDDLSQLRQPAEAYRQPAEAYDDSEWIVWYDDL